MITRWRIFWSVGVVTLLTALFFKNRHDYKNQSYRWLAGKSLIELVIICAGVALAPGFLVAVIVAAIVKPIKGNWSKVIVGLSSSIVLGVVAAFCAEGIAIASVFCINARTGDSEEGILRNWRKNKDLHDQAA